MLLLINDRSSYYVMWSNNRARAGRGRAIELSVCTGVVGSLVPMLTQIPQSLGTRPSASCIINELAPIMADVRKRSKVYKAKKRRQSMKHRLCHKNDLLKSELQQAVAERAALHLVTAKLRK